MCQEQVCGICLGGLRDGGRTRRTRCNHEFHQTCLSMSLQYRLTCPICRQDCAYMAREPQPRPESQSIEMHWLRVHNSFGDPPPTGPLIPSHQRQQDFLLFGIPIPALWSNTWMTDTIAEMRMRYNLGPSILLHPEHLIDAQNRGARFLPDYPFNN